MAKNYTYTVIAKASFGGFEAWLSKGGLYLFVQGLQWKGPMAPYLLESQDSRIGCHYSKNALPNHTLSRGETMLRTTSLTSGLCRE